MGEIKSNKVMITGSLLMAFIYSLCFTGTKVYPMLSFFIFCCAGVIVMYISLKKLNYLVNEKAFFWAVPIIIISALNSIFSLNFFSYTNVIMIHILFAVMGYTAVHGKPMPFSEISGWFDILRVCIGNIPKGKKSKVVNVAARVLLGAGISVPVLILIMIFLLDADAVFKSIVNNAYDSVKVINLSFLSHLVCIIIVSIYLSGYVFNLKHMEENKIKTPVLNLDMIIGATFLSLINLIFLFFCVVQMAFLFTGGYMTLPQGIVYSSYAREGFFQLLFVTIINFGVIIVFLKLFPDCVNRKPIKILLSMLSIFTGILICSSFYRMSLYISAYGYTDIRMMVITFLIMEMVCICITLVYIFKPAQDFLKQYLYVGLTFYILVNITASQFCVTSLNVKRFYNGKALDINQFYMNFDSAAMLADIIDSEEFQERTDSHDKEQAKAFVVSFKEYEDEHWQNWSLLHSLSQDKVK